MKLLAVFAFASLSFSAAGQFVVSPYGAAQPSAPPVGEERKSVCGDSCALDLRIRPFCFGTNLRAFSSQNQLYPRDPVTMKLTLTNPNDATKKDQIDVVFPSQATFPTSGTRFDCTVLNPEATGSQRDIECQQPDTTTTSVYKLSEWKTKSNPLTPNCPSGDYCRYSVQTMPAKLTSGPAGADSDVSCLHRFTRAHNSGTLKNDVVSCFFPSKLPNFTSSIKVFNNGTDITSNVEIKAFTNSIDVMFKGTLNSLPDKQVVRHGKIIAGKSPSFKMAYTQSNGTNVRSLATIPESATFDEANGNKSFTAVVKFPGSEGYCGGFYSPLMLFFDKDIPQFKGVSTFPLYGVAENARVHWPESGSKGYFLVNLGTKKSVEGHQQLFGQDATFANGFDALKVHDANGDGVIDAKDAIFSSLKLWNDKNGDGVSQAEELVSLGSKGVESISLKYSNRDVSKFEGRAIAREKSTFKFKHKTKVVTADIYDVWLSPID